MSPFELVFVKRAPDITKLKIPEIGNVGKSLKDYHILLKERAKLIDALYLNWKTAGSTVSTSQELKIIKI